MTFTIEVPQLIFIILVIVDMVFVSIHHGKEKKINSLANLFSHIIVFSILYWGGFFS